MLIALVIDLIAVGFYVVVILIVDDDDVFLL